MNWTIGVILLCFFLSGASSLVYEVIWMRMLVLVFGSTTLATSTVLTAFMAGLALGSLWFGRLIDRWRRPLLVYGVLEIAIGIYALLVPVLFPLMVPLYQMIWEGYHPSFYLFSLFRFVLAASVLLIPTTLMGATLPVLASFYAGKSERSERRIGLLYTFNTAGAVLGTLGAGYILLPELGVQKTILVAAEVNLILGLVAIAISQRRMQLIGPAIVRTDREPGKEAWPITERSFAALAYTSRPPESVGTAVVALTLAAFAISGYTALVYEVAWTRILSLVLGSSVYAFSTMLSIFLLGLALGSAIFTKILNRIRWPVWTFAGIQIGIGLSCYATSLYLEKLPFFFLRALGSGLAAFPDHPDRLILALWFASAAGVMILPTLLFGGSFPLVAKTYLLYAHQAGRTTGDVYSVNTLGAILGAFLGGFVLIPALGLQNTLLTTILLNLALGMILLLTPPSNRLRALAALLVLAIGTGLLWAKIPWNQTMMTFNLGIEYPRYLNLMKALAEKKWSQFKDQLDRNLSVDFYEEGRSATVTVVRDAVGHRYLKNDGRPEGGEPYLRTHVMLAQLPLLLSDRINHGDERALIIGLGTGVTLGSAQHHDLAQIEVVELEPAVVRAAAYFRNISQHQMDDPRLNLIVNDGRNYLLVNPRSYDTIISQPSFPWLTGVANLFTRDFFELGAQRLREGGIFCQWISVYGMTLEGFKSVLKAFQSVFPYVMVFDPAPPDMIFIGSKSPFRIDLARVQEAMIEDPLKEELARIGVRDAADLMAAFALGSQEMDVFLADAAINTDDNARVEVSGPRDYYSGRINGQPEAIRDTLYRTHKSLEHYLITPEETTDQQRADQMLKLARAYFEQEKLQYASFYANRSLEWRESADAHLLMARLLLAYAQAPPERGLPLINRQPIFEAAIAATQVALRLDPRLSEGLALQAELYQGLGDMDHAISSYQKFVEMEQGSPDPHYTLASLLQAQGRHREARRHYERFLALAARTESYAGLVELARKQLEVLEP